MKRFSTGGFTAAGVLVLALAAGGVGGVMAMGGSHDAPAASPPAVSVNHVADEAPADAAASAADVPAEAPVVAPEPTAAAAPSAEDSAAQAAQSAKEAQRAAKRSEDAADRAESAAPTPKPAAPVATPKPTPAPAPASTSFWGTPEPDCSPNSPYSQARGTCAGVCPAGYRMTNGACSTHRGDACPLEGETGTDATTQQDVCKDGFWHTQSPQPTPAA